MSLLTERPGRPAIIAHRGASQIAPENTLAAFRLAWEMGSDAIELDLRLTSDGHIVVIHDAGTLRTTGFDAPVGSLSLEEIRRLDAGSLAGPRWKGERIPTLGEVLALTPKGKRVFLECKDSVALFGPLEGELLAAKLEPRQVALTGFDHALMAEAKRRFPNHAVRWIHEFAAGAAEPEWPALRRRLMAEATEGRFDGIDLGVHPILDASFISEMHERKLSVLAWTVNDLAAARRLIDAGINGITTDVPDLLLELRNRPAS